MMTVYVQKEDGGNLCYESALVYRQCILDARKCIAVDAERVLDGNPLTDCDLFVGSVEAVSAVLTTHKIDVPEPDYYPASLSKYLGREVWKSNVKEVLGFIAAEQPIFAKSHHWKDITGQVFDGTSGNSLLLDRDENHPMWLSRIVSFVSEHRAYVLNGKILSISHYFGDENLSVDPDVIAQAVVDHKDSPIAYAFDCGLTAGKKIDK